MYTLYIYICTHICFHICIYILNVILNSDFLTWRLLHVKDKGHIKVKVTLKNPLNYE